MKHAIAVIFIVGLAAFVGVSAATAALEPIKQISAALDAAARR